MTVSIVTQYIKVSDESVWTKPPHTLLQLNANGHDLQTMTWIFSHGPRVSTC